MNDLPEQAEAFPAGSSGRESGAVAASLTMAFFTFAGHQAFAVLLFAFVAWKLTSGSRVAYWLLSLTAFGWGLVQLSDIVKGNDANPHLSEWIHIWSRCLCGLAAPVILWFRRGVPDSGRHLDLDRDVEVGDINWQPARGSG